MARKNKILLVLVALFLLININNIIVAHADSGWDSSYDSSSSWDSGSSWDSSSSWGNDYYINSSGEMSSVNDPMAIVIVTILFLVVVFIITAKAKPSTSRSMPKTIVNNINYEDKDIIKINDIIPDFNLDEFKGFAFNTYKDIQTAWMNFDTDAIRKMVTDELYNMYSAQLTTLKVKKQKNIMKNIEYVDAKIVDVNNDNNITTVTVYLNVKVLDYVIDEKTGKTLRGRDDRRLNIEYMLTFVRSSTDSKKIEKCPNCGAPVDIVASATCPYCDSVLVKNASDFVLSKKECIGQKID